MMRSTMTGLILRVTPVQEFDKIISLFTAEWGLIRVMAKGVRRIKSRRSCHIDLLNYVRIEVEESGRQSHSPRYVREIATIHAFHTIKKDPQIFASGCLIAWFLLRMIPPEALSQERELFGLTMETLEQLAEGPRPRQIILRKYFSGALKILGHLRAVGNGETLRDTLWETLSLLDPQFTLQARRTLGIFSRSESTPSN